MHVGDVDVQRFSLLSWAQDGRWAVDSSPGRFIPLNGRPSGSQNRSWYFGEEKNLFQDSNPGLPSPWSIRYTDYAVPADVLNVIPSSVIVHYVVQCSTHLKRFPGSFVGKGWDPFFAENRAIQGVDICLLHVSEYCPRIPCCFFLFFWSSHVLHLVVACADTPLGPTV